jgi:cell division protein FtsW
MAAVALAVPYMRERVVIWLDPWRDPQGAGYHIIQSLTAIGSGGLLGKGLGWSQQKLWYLPEAHTDFIFSIIGEEFGLLGTAGVILLFVLLLREGIRVARNAPDIFGSALAFGITMMISIQAAFNVAVTTKALPTKGIALPFISFGGSSMLFTLAAVGILVNVARHCVEPVPAVAPAPAPVSPLAPAPAPASASVAPAASSAPSSVSST